MVKFPRSQYQKEICEISCVRVGILAGISSKEQSQQIESPHLCRSVNLESFRTSDNKKSL